MFFFPAVLWLTSASLYSWEIDCSFHFYRTAPAVAAAGLLCARSEILIRRTVSRSGFAAPAGQASYNARSGWELCRHLRRCALYDLSCNNNNFFVAWADPSVHDSATAIVVSSYDARCMLNPSVNGWVLCIAFFLVVTGGANSVIVVVF